MSGQPCKRTRLSLLIEESRSVDDLQHLLPLVPLEILRRLLASHLQSASASQLSAVYWSVQNVEHSVPLDILSHMLGFLPLLERWALARVSRTFHRLALRPPRPSECAHHHLWTCFDSSLRQSACVQPMLFLYPKEFEVYFKVNPARLEGVRMLLRHRKSVVNLKFGSQCMLEVKNMLSMAIATRHPLPESPPFGAARDSSLPMTPPQVPASGLASAVLASPANSTRSSQMVSSPSKRRLSTFLSQDLITAIRNELRATHNPQVSQAVSEMQRMLHMEVDNVLDIFDRDQSINVDDGSSDEKEKDPLQPLVLPARFGHDELNGLVRWLRDLKGVAFISNYMKDINNFLQVFKPKLLYMSLDSIRFPEDNDPSAPEPQAEFPHLAALGLDLPEEDEEEQSQVTNTSTSSGRRPRRKKESTPDRASNARHKRLALDAELCFTDVEALQLFSSYEVIPLRAVNAVLRRVRFVGIDMEYSEVDDIVGFNEILSTSARLVHLSITGWHGELVVPPKVHSLVVQRWFKTLDQVFFHVDHSVNPPIPDSQLFEIKMLANFSVTRGLWQLQAHQRKFLNRLRQVRSLRVIHIVNTSEELIEQQLEAYKRHWDSEQQRSPERGQGQAQGHAHTHGQGYAPHVQRYNGPSPLSFESFEAFMERTYPPMPRFNKKWHRELHVVCPKECAEHPEFRRHFPYAQFHDYSFILRNPYYTDEEWEIRRRLQQCSDLFMIGLPDELKDPK